MANEVMITVKARSNVPQVMAKDAEAIKKFTRDASGRMRDARGRFVKDAAEIGASGERAGRGIGRISQWVDKVKKKLGELGPNMVRTLAKAASYGTSVGAVFAGPVTAGILGAVKATVALGKAGAALAPMAAFLPSIAASVGLLKGTLTLAGPGMLKAISPLTREFANTDKEVGRVTKTVQRLASAGLEPLAKKFVKVNLPAIEEGMAGVATNINRVAVNTGKWLNSAQGQSAIRVVTDATADAADRLAPKFTRAAIALGRLVNRAGDRAITSLGNLLGKAADKATELINSISREDINNALKKASDAGESLWGKLVKIKEVVAWLGEHQGLLTGISDALAVTSIAVGAASGNWVAIIAGAATLILNHFDTLKSGVSKIWETISNDPGVQKIWDVIVRIATAIKEDLQAAFEQARPYIEQFGQVLAQAWEKAAPLIAQFLENPEVVAGIKAIAFAIAGAAVAFLALSAATAAVAAGITGTLGVALAWITGVFAKAILTQVALIIGAFGEMVGKIGDAMAKLPGKAGEIGRSLQGIGQNAKNAAGKVLELRDGLGQLRSKEVTVTFGARFTKGSGDIFRAAASGAPGQGLGVLRRATGGIVGGITRAATGGARSGSVLVGEQGPELVQLPTGSMVRSAASTRGIMGGLKKGLAAAILGSERDVTAAMDRLWASVKKSSNRGAQRLVKSFREHFLELAKRREAFLAPMREAVREARKNYVDLVNTVRDNLISEGGIGNGGTSFTGIVGNLQSKITSAQQFTAILAKLRKAGLDQASVQQLVAAGPEMGLAAARSILASGGAGVRQIAGLQRNLAAAGTALGTQAAESRYRPDIVRAEAVLEINTAGARMDDFLLEILRKAIRAKGGNVQIVLGKAAKGRSTR